MKTQEMKHQLKEEPVQLVEEEPESMDCVSLKLGLPSLTFLTVLSCSLTLSARENSLMEPMQPSSPRPKKRQQLLSYLTSELPMPPSSPELWQVLMYTNSLSFTLNSLTSRSCRSPETMTTTLSLNLSSKGSCEAGGMPLQSTLRRMGMYFWKLTCMTIFSSLRLLTPPKQQMPSWSSQSEEYNGQFFLGLKTVMPWCLARPESMNSDISLLSTLQSLWYHLSSLRSRQTRSLRNSFLAFMPPNTTMILDSSTALWDRLGSIVSSLFMRISLSLKLIRSSRCTELQQLLHLRLTSQLPIPPKVMTNLFLYMSELWQLLAELVLICLTQELVSKEYMCTMEKGWLQWPPTTTALFLQSSVVWPSLDYGFQPSSLILLKEISQQMFLELLSVTAFLMTSPTFVFRVGSRFFLLSFRFSSSWQRFDFLMQSLNSSSRFMLISVFSTCSRCLLSSRYLNMASLLPTLE